MAKENEIALIESKSDLAKIREQISANEGVYLAGEIVKFNAYGGWAQTVSIIVAPVEPIYEADKLNHFMDGLIKDIPTSARDAAHKWDVEFSLGKLYFDEPIGIKRTVVTTTISPIEGETLQAAGIASGQSQAAGAEMIQRRTWLRVYPDQTSAKTVFDYEEGVNNGTVEPNINFDSLSFRLDNEQLRKLKASLKS